MFFRLYRTRIKCLCRNYETLFWSFGFPILLSLFFYMGFNNLTSGENLDTIPIAVVSESSNTEFIVQLENVEISRDKKMFDVQKTSEENAKVLLDNNKINGYIVYDEKPNLFIKKNGIEQTIIKSFLDNYELLSSTAKNIISMNPENMNTVMKDLMNYENYVVDGADKTKNPDFTVIYFYSLIALACLFGSNWGFREMSDIQADQSAIGARINVAPTHKMRLLVCNLLAAFTLHFASVMFLLAFLDNILNIEFGNKMGFILLISLLGSLCGISLGAMVCVTVKANDKVKSAILTVVGLGGGFLAGMMIFQMKYIIATKAPIISYINPASLITDAFYCLYYYDGYEKFYFNAILLGVLTLIFSIITYYSIRRREYASI
jgi:ABC-2 type transport system permease protein